MPYFRRETKSGKVHEIEIYYATKDGRKYPRRANEDETTEDQAHANRRMARKKLANTINANFTPADIFVTLSYAKEPSLAASKKHRSEFLEKVKAYCRKSGLAPPKWVAVTESEGVDRRLRTHHHIVMSGIPLDVLKGMWTRGRLSIETLDKSGDYTELANYLSKAFPLKANGKRWSQSKGLLKPTVTKVRVRKPSLNTKKPMTLPPNLRMIQHRKAAVNGYIYEYARAVEFERDG